MQALAPAAPYHEIKAAVLGVYNEFDAAYDRFPNDHFSNPFVLSETDIYDGQRLFMKGPDGEEFLLDRPDPSKIDPGARTVEVMAHDNTERMFLLGSTGTSNTLITPDAADVITRRFFGWPVTPQIHERAMEEIDQGVAEVDKTVRPFLTIRHVEALGRLISQGQPIKDMRYLRSV